MSTSESSWTICPECGRGPGEDHKLNCSRRNRPITQDYSKNTVADLQKEVLDKPSLEKNSADKPTYDVHADG